MKNLFFDFDGTIANTQEGIVNALEYMVNDLKMEHLGVDTYKKFIGPSLVDSLERFYPDFPKARYQEAVKSFQSYYNTKGVYQLELYSGMKDMLQQLKDAGYNLYISSVKTESMLKILIPHLGLDNYFEGFYGQSEDGFTRNTKPAILKYGLDNSESAAEDSIMIGDRMTDMQGGVQNNVHTLGITYGFGDHQELKDSGAELIVDHVDDIPDAVKKFK
ncbi:HAD hydrolase-like protein [Companilactobacillus formosensis]|jgi:phosphoglycolate phosphatase|uniref:HAD hydrolase-like protein n=1 Tax=Companilactobacillus formosensis TaxID=1617889 RepID=UPI000E64A102|nr:HAD hydrolase-like protein [Companilactobacillus formosensis]